MSGFEVAKLVEARALQHLMPFLDQRSDGRLVLTSKGVLARHLQQTVGDVIMNIVETMWTVEIKAEERETGNLFLEMFSNRNLDDRESYAERGVNPGWMFKLRSDLLFYYFIDTEALYVARLLRLQRWAFGWQDEPGRIWRYEQRRATKYHQLNDTWGAIVPISDLIAGIAMRKCFPRQIEMFGDGISVWQHKK